MNDHNFRFLDLSGIDVFDYYYPYHLGSPGWMFRYIMNKNKYQFTLPQFHLSYILKFLYYFDVKPQCQVLDKYLEGGFMFIDDKILDDSWLVTDRELMIDNLSHFTKSNLDYVIYKADTSKFALANHDLSAEFSEDILPVGNNLISYLKDSRNYELNLFYI